jgi:hypothetical protein
VPSSQPFAQQTPAPAPNTTLPFPRLRIIMVSPTPRILPVPPIRLVAKPAEPLHKVVVATPAVPLHEVVKKKHKQYIIRLVVTSGHVEPNATVQTTMDKQGPTTTTNATVQTTMDKQGPTTTTSTTPKATLSTTTSTTAACGDVRMSPGVATAAVLATAQIQNQVSGEPNQNHVSTEPNQNHVSCRVLPLNQPCQINRNMSLPNQTKSSSLSLPFLQLLLLRQLPTLPSKLLSHSQQSLHPQRRLLLLVQ